MVRVFTALEATIEGLRRRIPPTWRGRFRAWNSRPQAKTDFDKLGDRLLEFVNSYNQQSGINDIDRYALLLVRPMHYEVHLHDGATLMTVEVRMEVVEKTSLKFTCRTTHTVNGTLNDAAWESRARGDGWQHDTAFSQVAKS